MDYKIVIDPGHGGTDGGSQGNGISEKDLNLTISELMYQRFQDLGVPVTMTRQTDETVSPTERVKRILGAYGDSSNVIVISNHINAGGGDGAEVIYALRNNDKLSNLIATEIQREGQNIRNVYQRRLPSDTSKDYYFIHRDTGKTQPVIVEYGFLDSPKDDVQQLKNDYPKYVDAVVRAVMEYIGKNPPSGGGNGTYTVKSGDSLWSIAKTFNTSVDELKKLNNLTSNALRIGQTLKVPTTGGGNSFYIVKSGDSLYKIANTYNTTVDELMKLNNLTNTNLTIGQQLRVPGGTVEPPVTPPAGGGGSTYTVKPGDSLYKIANAYNTTVDNLMRINNLTSNILNVGQVLKVPTNSGGNNGSGEKTYVVKNGDSLYKIANSYNTTVAAIRKQNNLGSDNLSIGQVLIIP